LALEKVEELPVLQQLDVGELSVNELAVVAAEFQQCVVQNWIGIEEIIFDVGLCIIELSPLDCLVPHGETLPDSVLLEDFDLKLMRGLETFFLPSH
jgi:hypothetical protein